MSVVLADPVPLKSCLEWWVRDRGQAPGHSPRPPVKCVINAGCGHGLTKITIFPSVDTELFGITVETSALLSLFPP